MKRQESFRARCQLRFQQYLAAIEVLRVSRERFVKEQRERFTLNQNGLLRCEFSYAHDPRSKAEAAEACYRRCECDAHEVELRAGITCGQAAKFRSEIRSAVARYQEEMDSPLVPYDLHVGLAAAIELLAGAQP